MRNRRGITVAALLVVIIGMSIGFAAFSNTLTIKSTANVTPVGGSLGLVFAKNTNVNNLDYTAVSTYTTTGGATGESGTIDNTGSPKLKGLKANFTAPGQSVSYRVYVVNTGNYTAYLTNLNFLPVTGVENPACRGLSGATSSLVTAACADMHISVRIGSTNGVGGTLYTSNNDNITGKSIAPGSSTEVYVTLTYADNSPSPNHYVDGPMVVVFGDIVLQYRSTPTSTPIVVEEELPFVPEYVVDNEGVILAYTGEGGNIAIPNSLPYYIIGDQKFYMNLCIATVMEYYSVDQSAAKSTCNGYKTDFETNGSNMEMYDSFLAAGIISYDIIPTGTNVIVTGIGDNVFYEADLTSVTLPNTLETIGNMAFMYNELQSINIPNSVKSIGYSAFAFNNLTSVTIGTGITSIGQGAFSSGTDDGYGPNALTSVSINVACDTYQAPFTSSNQFGWANNYSNSNIVWGTACSS